MWYLASKYADNDTALEVYNKIQSFSQQAIQEFSVVRLLLSNIPHVVVYSYQKPTLHVKTLAKILSSGNVARLDTDTLKQLFNRREQKIIDATSIGHGMKFVEEHTPIPLPDTSFESTILQAPNNSPLKAGDTMKITVVPFLKAYEDIHKQSTIDTFINSIGAIYNPDIALYRSDMELMEHLILGVETYILKHADKYMFSPSAIDLLQSVFNQNNATWLSLHTDMWIELEKPISTPYGENIKGLWVYDTFHTQAINAIAPDKAHRDTLYQIFSPYQYYWSFIVVDMNCKNVFDFTYDIQKNQWIYLVSHICPYGACQYPKATINDIDDKFGTDTIIPCEECKQALNYWSTFLHTAIRIVRKDYTTTPNTDTPYELHREHYEEHTKKSVGKGKNIRHIATTVTHTIDYHVVTFVLGASENKAPLTQKQTHQNWLKLADKDTIIWEKRLLAPYQRRYPIRKNGTRQEGMVSIQQPYYQYIPMLRTNRATIKRIVIAPKLDTKE